MCPSSSNLLNACVPFGLSMTTISSLRGIDHGATRLSVEIQRSGCVRCSYGYAYCSSSYSQVCFLKIIITTFVFARVHIYLVISHNVVILQSGQVIFLQKLKYIYEKPEGFLSGCLHTSAIARLLHPFYTFRPSFQCEGLTS